VGDIISGTVGEIIWEWWAASFRNRPTGKRGPRMKREIAAPYRIKREWA
jgi:hypothetical protein